jgi:hypothetical protein
LKNSSGLLVLKIIWVGIVIGHARAGKVYVTCNLQINVDLPDCCFFLEWFCKMDTIVSDELKLWCPSTNPHRITSYITHCNENFISHIMWIHLC